MHNSNRHRDDPMRSIAIPLAYVGALLILSALLAIVFYVAAQVVQTP